MIENSVTTGVHEGDELQKEITAFIMEITLTLVSITPGSKISTLINLIR